MKAKRQLAQQAMGSFTEEGVNSLSDSLHEPDWLRIFRLDAFQRYKSLPLELSPLYTKYANVSIFDPDQFKVGAPETLDLRSHFAGYLSGKERNIVLQGNSTTIHVDLDESLREGGLEVLPFAEAIVKREPLMRQIFQSRQVRSDEERYAAFNNAFFNAGTLIVVPRGLRAEVPLRRMLLVKNPSGSVVEQTIIQAEEDSQLNFLEELYTAESRSPYLVSSVVEVRAGQGSRVDTSTVQLLDDRAVYLANRNFTAMQDARATNTGIYLGASILRARTNLVMRGRGSAVEGFEVFFCDGRQRYDFESNLLHTAQDTSASTHARGVLKGESQSIFKGMIKITKDAKNANSYLAHHAMIMDKRARSDGIPGLSIDTNEVKATHSASVAQIDEEELFYLMTRGLSEDEAKKMIVLGFFEPVLARIPVEIAREGAKFMLEGKWEGKVRRLVDRETLLALTGEVPSETRQQGEDIFERHYKYR